ncbi:MAG: L-rhamnose mutarotase [Alphaproteobacteria bacterium]|nr:L-rhamnose mutarotase [Alphaproteobacteria bacterium]
MRLRPGAEAQYDEAHARVWPDLLAEMRNAGVARFIIYRDKLDVFAWQERAAPFPEPGTQPSEVLKMWWHAMKPLMLTEPDGRPKQTPMTEVFVLTADEAGT